MGEMHKMIVVGFEPFGVVVWFSDMNVSEGNEEGNE